MAEAICSSCGEIIPYEPSPDLPLAIGTCPRCFTTQQVGGLKERGAETILIPEGRMAAGHAPGDGTMLLQADQSVEPPVKVQVKGFLTQEGVPSGEADYRLRPGTTVVGREGGAIRVDDVAISAHHFHIEERGNEFFMRDLGSRNGTFLNGHRVRSAKLKSSDRITAGGTSFTFSVRQVIPL